MIILDKPVSVIAFETNELKPVFVDSSEHKHVHAYFSGFGRPLILWEGSAYDSIGDWTEVQAKARILELLGNDPQQVMNTLVL